MFAEAHPDIEIVNAVIAGGAGTNYKPALTSRMQAGEPPDAFQAHGGAELANMWVAPGFTEPIGDVYDKLGLADKFPQGVIDLVSVDGEPYAVPVNVHRNGVLWFNKKVLEDNGVTPPTTWDEFFTAADTLKAAGVDPVALGDKDGWTAVNLFEQILLSQLGAEDYRGLWAGSMSWTDPRVTTALETFSKVLDYVNADHATLSWDQAAAKLREHQEVALFIEGHADQRGAPEYNLALGQRRGATVANYLIRSGVSNDRLSVVSYGEERPTCTETTEGCYAKNRRVHFTIQ